MKIIETKTGEGLFFYLFFHRHNQVNSIIYQSYRAENDGISSVINLLQLTNSVVTQRDVRASNSKKKPKQGHINS